MIHSWPLPYPDCDSPPPLAVAPLHRFPPGEPFLIPSLPQATSPRRPTPCLVLERGPLLLRVVFVHDDSLPHLSLPSQDVTFFSPFPTSGIRYFLHPAGELFVSVICSPPFLAFSFSFSFFRPTSCSPLFLEHLCLVCCSSILSFPPLLTKQRFFGFSSFLSTTTVSAFLSDPFFLFLLRLPFVQSFRSTLSLTHSFFLHVCA